jgi:hypothetical protein
MQRKGFRNETASLSSRIGTRPGQAAGTPQASESHSCFVDRALAARDAARITGEYFTAEEVLRELDELRARTLAGPGE